MVSFYQPKICFPFFYKTNLPVPFSQIILLYIVENKKRDKILFVDIGLLYFQLF